MRQLSVTTIVSTCHCLAEKLAKSAGVYDIKPKNRVIFRLTVEIAAKS